MTLSSPTSAITTFAATAAQSYIFRVDCYGQLGRQGHGHGPRHHQRRTLRRSILFFIANPTQITAGQSATLSWSTQGATTVSISGIGNVPLAGSTSVSPTVTTQYTLTATNSTSSQTLTATVTVGGSSVQISSCFATPATIVAGESSTLFWQTTNATSVSISPGVGTEGANGSAVVSPTTSTTYTITAQGPNSATAACSVAVTVTAGNLPQIIQFSAAPMTIVSGSQSTLTWNVQNANTVNISPGLGPVSPQGSQGVSPTQTTTYILTATNSAGSITSQATVNVTPRCSVHPLVHGDAESVARAWHARHPPLHGGQRYQRLPSVA